MKPALIILAAGLGSRYGGMKQLQTVGSGGATIMDHPGNLRHPPAWHIAAMPHEFHQAPLFTGPHTLGAGEKLSFRFRILVHSGPLRKTEMGDRWEKFMEK